MARNIAALTAAILLAGTVQGGQAADGSFFSGAGKPQSAAPAAASPAGIPNRPKLEDFEAADNALAELWTRLPYTARHVMFVSRKAGVYGDYEQRSSSVFAPGEQLLTYLEPVGYGWKALGAGILGFGVTIDFEILTRNGKVLAGRQAFMKTDLASHYRNREFFVNLTLTINDIKPGDYVLAYTLHDNVGGRTTHVEQPFTVKAPS